MAWKFGIVKSWSPREKLAEAEFFLEKMREAGFSDEFKYYLSAFLSALLGVTAREALEVVDPRFHEWHESQSASIQGPELQLLRELRNAEAHLAGSPLYQSVGFDFGPNGVRLEGAKSESLTASISMNEREAATYVIESEGVRGESRPLHTSRNWVWACEGAPDVLESCERGIAVVRRVLDDWNRNGFGERE